MSQRIIIHDYVTPIRDILRSRSSEKRLRLHALLYQSRKVHHRHLLSRDIGKTLDKLSDVAWQKRLGGFAVEEWREVANEVWRRTVSIIGRPSPPEIVLYPGFGSFNGRVYNIDGRPVIGCSPDFPGCTGRNLEVLLAHEYAHFLRWQVTGVPNENQAIYTLLYDEGWAVWFTTQVLPEFSRQQVFMANLHAALNMPDPPGGYLRWCAKHLPDLATDCAKALRSQKQVDRGRFFQCQRYRDANTPIRVGYYLGYRIVAMLSRQASSMQLMTARPRWRSLDKWLDNLIGGFPL